MFRKIEERSQSSRDVVRVGTSKKPGTKDVGSDGKSVRNSNNLPEKSLNKYISTNSSKTPCKKQANKVSAAKFQIVSTKVQKSASKTKNQNPFERGKNLIKLKGKNEKNGKVKDIRCFFEKTKGEKNSVFGESVSDEQAYRGSYTAQPKRCDQQDQVPETELSNSTGPNLIKRGGVKYAT